MKPIHLASAFFPCLLLPLIASPSEAQQIQQPQSQSRPLRQFCHLGARVLDHEDGSTTFDCFCDLLGKDRYRKGPNRMSIVSATPETEYNFDPCKGLLLERAISNQYHIYLDAMVNNTVDELEVMEWSTTEFLAMKDTMKKGKAASYNVHNTRASSSSNRKLRKTSGLADETNLDAELKAGQRVLQYTHGQTTAWELLVVNVGGKDYDPPSNVTQLIDDWFEDDASLATQMAQCSANKTTFSPWKDAAGNDSDIFNGVMTILLNQSLAGIGVRTLESLVFEELADRGIVIERETGKIALCLPTETFADDAVYSNVAGYAIPNGNVAVYKGKHCNAVSTQMHEIGHTLGLQHSGDLMDITDPLPREDIFGDFSGIMGGWLSGDDAEICFNAAKTWQLGWRPTKDIIVGTDEPDELDLVLTSFVDWDGQETTYCIARVVTPDAFFFVHYNRKKGANIDTQEYGDKVIVTRRSSKTGIRDIVSYVVAALSVDELFSVENVDGLGANMTIMVNSMDDSTVDISIAFSIVNVAPAAGPARNHVPLATSQLSSLQRSVVPSLVPTIETTSAPSVRPSVTTSFFPSVPLPSTNPSVDPSRAPTSLPSRQIDLLADLPSVILSSSPLVQATRTLSQKPSVSSSINPSGLLPSAYPSTDPSPGTMSHPSSFPSYDSFTPSYGTSIPSETQPGFPSSIPTIEPTTLPSVRPSESTSIPPSLSLTSTLPSADLSRPPTSLYSQRTVMPSDLPQAFSSSVPTVTAPSNEPSNNPTEYPSENTTNHPTKNPTKRPTEHPSENPTNHPTRHPTKRPTDNPTEHPSENLTNHPTRTPTKRPTNIPTNSPDPPTHKPVPPTDYSPVTQMPAESPSTSQILPCENYCVGAWPFGCSQNIPGAVKYMCHPNGGCHYGKSVNDVHPDHSFCLFKDVDIEMPSPEGPTTAMLPNVSKRLCEDYCVGAWPFGCRQDLHGVVKYMCHPNGGCHYGKSVDDVHPDDSFCLFKDVDVEMPSLEGPATKRLCEGYCVGAWPFGCRQDLDGVVKYMCHPNGGCHYGKSVDDVHPDESFCLFKGV